MAPAWQALAVLALAAALVYWPAWQTLERRGFDTLTVTLPPEPIDLPIVVVGIDEPSFAEFAMAWPWQRSLHAELVDALNAAGAAVIAFDIVFADPTAPAEDGAFAAAIGRHGGVVLAGDLVYQQQPNFEQIIRVDPLGELLEAGASTGIASVSMDADMVVRQLPAAREAFWREIVRAWNRQAGANANPDLPANALIRYLPPGEGFRYASYYQALAPAVMLPPDFLRGKIVLVGLSLKASPEPGKARPDQFATPYLASTGWLTPGVELVAMEVANGLMDRAVTMAPRWQSLLLVALSLAAALPFLWHWQPLLAGLATAALVLAQGGLAVGLFAGADYWLPVAAPALALLSLFLLRGISAYLAERRQKRKIRRAFEHYVPPSVVAEMLGQPELLVLGGERREITAMFTDLAGFTSQAEQLDPESVTRVLNEHFDRMANLVIDHGGTIDKFIGDAIAAFWNAPLADAEHTLHACQAAIAMQAEMEVHRASLRERGLPEIHMRIGIHTGEAVVGNVGASTRFDYTAVGDMMNLASRLEGVNKLYGTNILTTADVASTVGDRVTLWPLDIIRVKGKQRPVEVYTCFADDAVGERLAEAVALFRQRDWQAALPKWQALLELPGCGAIAQLYIDRIGECMAAPPPAGWDMSYALEKM